jgi:hypothetical protein
MIIPNKNISTDWGIISKTLKLGQNTVFALYLDLNTGWIAVYSKLSRGLAGETLLEYRQAFGLPETILHDNAADYLMVTLPTSAKKMEFNRYTAHHITPTRTQQSITWT